MNKLVWLTLLIIASNTLTVALGQVKASKDSVSISSDTIPAMVVKPVTIPAVAKPSPGLVVNFKDLFESGGMNTDDGPRLNPRAVSFVQDYIGKYGKGLTKIKEWSRPYFNMMDAVFIENALPCELKYLAMIESRLNPTAVSWAGAVGPWQFMPGTAIRMGLKVNRRIDERTNYIKSTQAAARYLTELYAQFGDWLLVIAAYNGGAGNVLKAIRRSGSRNFWDIQYYLPAESRNHVKKFISTHYVFEGQGGLTTLTRAESDEHYGSKKPVNQSRNINDHERTNAKEQLVTGKFCSSVIARNLMMELNEFNRYNPNFDKIMSGASNTYQLMLPVDKMNMFNTVKYKILSESIELLLNHVSSSYSNEVPVTGSAPDSK